MRPWLILLCLLGGSCRGESAPPIRVPVTITVDDGDRSPVPGAELVSGGTTFGVTDRSGRLTIELSGLAGQTIPLAINCPPGTEASASALPGIVLRRLRGLDSAAPVGAARRVAFGCIPATRMHLLVVRTDHRAGLPIVVTGQTAATTDDAGVAQLVLEGPPGEEIEVSIDTSARPALRPASPSRRLRLPDRSRFLVFDQRFEERTERRPRNRRRAAAGPRRL